MFLQQLGILVIEIWIHKHHVHVTWYQVAHHLRRRAEAFRMSTRTSADQDVLKRMPFCNNACQAFTKSNMLVGFVWESNITGLSCCRLESTDSLTPFARTAAKSAKNNSTTISGCCGPLEVMEKRIYAKVLKNFNHSVGPAAAMQAGKPVKREFIRKLGTCPTRRLKVGNRRPCYTQCRWLLDPNCAWMYTWFQPCRWSQPKTPCCRNRTQ